MGNSYLQVIDPVQWMSNLPPEITEQPLNMIAIPGSHDSFTYSITRQSTPSPDCEFYQRIRYLPSCIVSSFLYPWTYTQSASFTEQLNAGVRYFDLRVSIRKYKKNQTNYNFCLVHGQYAQHLTDELIKIREFLQNNPKEVVLLDCNHCYEFENDEQRTHFESVVLKILEPFMMPHQAEIPSLNEIWNAGFQVIFFSCHQLNMEKLDRHFWPPFRIKSFWPETINPDDMIKYLNSHIGHTYTNNTIYFTKSIEFNTSYSAVC